MGYLRVQLNDLPDEILMIIFGKLNNVELLYSLTSVNKRLKKIVHDSIFTKHLTLLRSIPNHWIDPQSASKYFVYPLFNPMFDRFCSQILPEIHDKIIWLDLEALSMERILLATNYPNLSGLGLFNITVEKAIHLFSDETLFTYIFKNQILSLVIDINTNAEQKLTRDVNAVNAVFFTHIITTFPNLQLLDIGRSGNWFQNISFDISPSTVTSLTLLELYVYLEHFSDCLYLLDGRFNQLRTLNVNIHLIGPSTFIINNNKELPNLRSFSLHCNMHTAFYDELILPLLHRMSNLEKLDLSLLVRVEKTFLDGNDMKRNIINYMPLLNKFTFNIRSFSKFYNKINLPSNAAVQHTFKDFKDNQIISCIDYFQEREYSQCHIYLYPYNMNHYDDITNNFPGGLFKCVCEVSLFDEHPFEHEFFLRIAQSFPLLKKLTLINEKKQQDKRFKKFKYENENLPIIKYPCLINLNLVRGHQDYHEEFLFDTKTCLPNNVRVHMDYPSVKKVTRNFRRYTSRRNCAKIYWLSFSRKSEFPEHLKDYFPHAIKIY